MIVCHCKGISDSTVRAAVRKGAAALGEVERACGAGTDCGGCTRTIQAIVAAEKCRTARHSLLASIRDLGAAHPAPLGS